MFHLLTMNVAPVLLPMRNCLLGETEENASHYNFVNSNVSFPDILCSWTYSDAQGVPAM